MGLCNLAVSSYVFYIIIWLITKCVSMGGRKITWYIQNHLLASRYMRVLQKVSALYFLKNLCLCYRHEDNVTFQYNLSSSRYI